MPYFTDETKFTLPATASEKKLGDEGWIEYDTQDGYSLQKKEIDKGTSKVTVFRKVRITE